MARKPGYIITISLTLTSCCMKLSKDIHRICNRDTHWTIVLLLMSAKCTWWVATDWLTVAGRWSHSIHWLNTTRPRIVCGQQWWFSPIWIHWTHSAHMFPCCNTIRNYTVTYTKWNYLFKQTKETSILLGRINCLICQICQSTKSQLNYMLQNWPRTNTLCVTIPQS